MFHFKVKWQKNTSDFYFLFYLAVKWLCTSRFATSLASLG